jgi:hypothetical protein
VLEVLGNEAMWSCRSLLGDSTTTHTGGCLAYPCAVVVTVNRVQSTYDVPIYDTPGGGLDSLNGLVMSRAARLDCARYGLQGYLSVHVEHLFLLTSTPPAAAAPPPPAAAAVSMSVPRLSARESPLSVDEVDVSVLLPVHNEEQWLARCLESLLRQDLLRSSDTQLRIEVVAVLNGCTDDSEAILQSHTSAFRGAGIPLIVLVLPEKGLVRALDAGLAVCRGRHVARLDADDYITCPLRLSRQSRHLDFHFPRIRVLGTQALLLPGGEEKVAEEARVAGGIPCDPVLVAWGMLFRCCVLHPSVMFHRDTVRDLGGYGGGGGEVGNAKAEEEGEEEEAAAGRVEDFSLWVRLLIRSVH